MEEPRSPEVLGRELVTIPPRQQEIFEEPGDPRIQDPIMVPPTQANTTNPPIINPDADRRLAETLSDQLLGSLDVNPNPSWGEAAVLGFQHYILSLGSSVMVPLMLVDLMGGSQRDTVEVVHTLVFVGGINTLMQTQFGTRLPVIIGGSYAFAVPIMSIITDPSLSEITDPNLRFMKTMSAVQGSLIVTSSFQILMGFSQTWGFCSRVFSSTTMVPLVCLVGFGLFYSTFPVAADCIEMGLPLLIIYTILSQYLRRFRVNQYPLLERLPFLISITFVWLYAHILTVSGVYRHQRPKTQHHCRTDMANLISSTPWVKVPYPFQWGKPTFDAGHAFGMMGAVLVSMIESTGAYMAATQLQSGTYLPALALSRGIGWQGLGTLLNGLFGGLTGCTVSIENVGLLGSTRMGSRRVAQVSAGFMILFSILGKLGALFASIPVPMFAAINCIMFGTVASVGLSLMQFTNTNSARTMYIIAISIFMGLSVSEYFDMYASKSVYRPVHSKATWINDFLNTVFYSSSAVALLVAVFLDRTIGDNNKPKEIGMHWWG